MPRSTAIPVLRVRRDEMAAAPARRGALDGMAARSTATSMPRSRALAGATVDYAEHLVAQPPHRPQRRRHPAGQRSRESRRSHRHRRALRPRGARRPTLGGTRTAPARFTTAPTTTRRAPPPIIEMARAAAAIARGFRGRSCSWRSPGKSAVCWAPRITRTIQRCRSSARSRCSISTWSGGRVAGRRERPRDGAVTRGRPQGGGKSGGGTRIADAKAGRRAEATTPRSCAADPGDQLLHRLPRRLPSAGRRLGEDRRRRDRAGGDAGAGVRRAHRRARADRPAFVDETRIS